MTKERPDISDLGQSITGWLHDVYGDGLTMESQMVKLEEEVGEARDSLDRDQEDLGDELVDVGIVVIGMLALLQRDFITEALAKQQITHKKYDPETVRDLVSQGYSVQESLSICRQLWIKNNS